MRGGRWVRGRIPAPHPSLLPIQLPATVSSCLQRGAQPLNPTFWRFGIFLLALLGIPEPCTRPGLAGTETKEEEEEERARAEAEAPRGSAGLFCPAWLKFPHSGHSREQHERGCHSSTAAMGLRQQLKNGSQIPGNGNGEAGTRWDSGNVVHPHRAESSEGKASTVGGDEPPRKLGFTGGVGILLWEVRRAGAGERERSWGEGTELRQDNSVLATPRITFITQRD